MSLLRTNYFKFSRTLVVGILFITVPLCFAGEKEDLAAASELIAIVEGGKTDQAKQAKRLFDSIPAESKSKPIAAYSLALVHIRENQLLEASKVLSAPSQDPESIRVGKERLKLWLTIETGSAAEAEPQFKRLVIMTLAPDSPIGDQTASCGFIGGVIGMLKTDVDAPCVPISILDKAKEALLTKVKAKTAILELEKQLAEASGWGAELSALVGKFERIGTDKAAEQNKSTQAELERAKQEQLKLRDDLKSSGGDKRDLDDQRRKKIQERKVEQENFLREKKNQPAPPVDPGRQPQQPRKPIGEYKTNPKTQKREFEEPSAREMQLYQQQKGLYDSWPNRYRQFEQDKMAYQGKVQLWQQKIATCEARVKAVDDAIKATEGAMKDMQGDIKQGVGKELKEAGDELEQYERLAAVSNLAYKHVVSNDPKAKNLFRPSNFRLLDYAAESVRLRKSIRE